MLMTVKGKRAPALCNDRYRTHYRHSESGESYQNTVIHLLNIPVDYYLVSVIIAILILKLVYFLWHTNSFELCN